MMNKNKMKIRGFVPCALGISLGLIGLVICESTPAAGQKRKPADASDTFFSSSEVPRIQIDIPEDGMRVLRKYEWKFGPQEQRESVLVAVREGAMVYTNVALHLKGAAGSFRGVEQNPALTLNFAKSSKGQRFHGLSKLSLNNSVQDPSLTTEQLCRELFLKAGVPVPRAAHAWVSLNGRDLGLYVLVEGWDRQFLKRHFRNPGGNLYDGGFLKDVDSQLAVNAGDPKNQSDRIALAKAAAESNLTNRQARLEQVLDVDRFLTYVALDVMLWDWDGYAQNRNNWRLYDDIDKNRMVFMPHGMDQMFWKPEGSILPPMQGLVAKAVLEIPEWRARYFERMKSLRATVFDPQWMTNRVREINASFLPLLEQKNPELAKEQQRAASDLCYAIGRRARSLDEQLGHPIEPLKFEPDGQARLAHWEAKVDFGYPVLTQRTNTASGSLLELGTQKGSSIGSWQTTVWLEKGRYQLRGRIKAEGIVPDPGDPRGGIGFRLGRQRPEKYLLGSSDWKEISHEFSINDLLSEVQLVCEFRGAKGEGWINARSLQLRKLPSAPQQ